MLHAIMKEKKTWPTSQGPVKICGLAVTKQLVWRQHRVTWSEKGVEPWQLRVKPRDFLSFYAVCDCVWRISVVSSITVAGVYVVWCGCSHAHTNAHFCVSVCVCALREWEQLHTQNTSLTVEKRSESEFSVTLSVSEIIKLLEARFFSSSPPGHLRSKSAGDHQLEVGPHWKFSTKTCFQVKVVKSSTFPQSDTPSQCSGSDGRLLQL